MSEFVKNRLRIECDNMEIIKKIKKLLFINGDDEKQVFTMQKMLPLPKELPDSGEYQLYGYDWSIAMWGTKYDALGCKISGNSDTISISYETATDPNIKWIEALCRYIYVMSYIDVLNGKVNISLSHSFYRLIDDTAVKLVWTPQKGFWYMEGERIY